MKSWLASTINNPEAPHPKATPALNCKLQKSKGTLITKGLLGNLEIMLKCKNAKSQKVGIGELKTDEVKLKAQNVLNPKL